MCIFVKLVECLISIPLQIIQRIRNFTNGLGIDNQSDQLPGLGFRKGSLNFDINLGLKVSNNLGSAIAMTLASSVCLPTF